MTITRLYETGFEWNNLPLEVYGVAMTGAGRVAVVNTTARTGNYCLRINGYFSRNYITQAFDGLLTQCRASFHFKSDPKTNSSTSHPILFALRNGSIATSPLITLRWNGTYFMVSAGYDNEAPIDYHVPLAISSDVDLNAYGVWRHIGIDVKIHATTGWIAVYYEGQRIINYIGQTNQIGSTFDRAIFGLEDFYSWGNTDPTYIYYDDIYIDDTTGESASSIYIPDRRFRLTGINDNGAFSDWLGSDGDNINNYLLVDDLPHDSDASYVETNTADLMDSYHVLPFTIPTAWSIEAVIPNVVAKSDAADGEIGVQLGMRNDVTTVLGDTTTMPTDYKVARSRFTLAPDGSSWSQEDLNDVEIVINSDG